MTTNTLSFYEVGTANVPTEAELLETAVPFRNVGQHAEWSSLWQDTLRTLNPFAHVEVHDDEFNAIKPELRRLSLPSNQVLLKEFLLAEVVSNGELSENCFVQTNGSNIKVTILASACRVGLFEVKSGEWCKTMFGQSFAEAWRPKISPLELFGRCWSPRLVAHLRQTVRWGWFAIREERCREAFDLLVDNPLGFTHEEVIKQEERGMLFLQAVAAATAIGAARFNGWRWEPTMFGLYLADDKSSWLNQ